MGRSHQRPNAIGKTKRTKDSVLIVYSPEEALKDRYMNAKTFEDMLRDGVFYPGTVVRKRGEFYSIWEKQGTRQTLTPMPCTEFIGIKFSKLEKERLETTRLNQGLTDLSKLIKTAVREYCERNER